MDSDADGTFDSQKITSYLTDMLNHTGFAQVLEEHISEDGTERVITYKPDGLPPYDHLTETRNAMSGARERTILLKKYLTDPNLTNSQRTAIQAELSVVSRILDAAERLLGELAQ